MSKGLFRGHLLVQQNTYEYYILFTNKLTLDYTIKAFRQLGNFRRLYHTRMIAR